MTYIPPINALCKLWSLEKLRDIDKEYIYFAGTEYSRYDSGSRALLATSQHAAYFPGISMTELVCFANSSGDSSFQDCQFSVKAEANLTIAVDQF